MGCESRRFMPYACQSSSTSQLSFISIAQVMWGCDICDPWLPRWRSCYSTYRTFHLAGCWCLFIHNQSLIQEQKVYKNSSCFFFIHAYTISTITLIFCSWTHCSWLIPNFDRWMTRHSWVRWTCLNWTQQQFEHLHLSDMVVRCGSKSWLILVD